MPCMAAMTPSCPKRGISAALRCWACSMRQRRSFLSGWALKASSKMLRVSRLARSPMAWTQSWKPCWMASSAVLRMSAGSSDPDKVEDLMRAMAAGIGEGDGGAHLKTYHPTGIQSSSTWFHNDPWLDFNMVQSRHIILNRTYDLIKTDWDRTPKPVVEGESVYEGIQDDLV